MISNNRVKEIVLAITNNQTLEVKEDIKDVCKIFKDQSLLHQLYNVFKLDYLKKYYLSGIAVSQYQESALAEIKDIFDENKIDYILLKGSFIKKFYPNHFLRLMGDIDVLVHEEDLEKASALLQNYKWQKFDEQDHHAEFKKNNIVIELHHKLFNGDSFWIPYFNNHWAHAKKTVGNEWEFDSVFFYMFQLGHLAKHMLGGGAGLRPFIDFYYMFKEYPVDINELKNAASEIKLDKFLDSVLDVLNYFFGFKICDYDKINCLDEYITHIIESGVHGHSSNNDYYAQKMAKKKESKFKFYLHTLFPSREIMKRNYPYLNKHPIFFPVARIQRIFRCIFVRGENIKKVNNATAQRDKIIKIYDEIGLYE